MKIKELFRIIFMLIVWVLLLPLAILATPFILISKLLDVEDSGYKGLIDFYSLPSFLIF